MAIGVSSPAADTVMKWRRAQRSVSECDRNAGTERKELQ